MNVGVDEAGRGSFLGRVYAGAVIWNPEIENPLLKDSKKLSKQRRKEMSEFIKENAIAYGVSYATNDEIDRMNILNATHLAMHRALDEVGLLFDQIHVDGDRFTPYKDVPHMCIIKGDDTCVEISAASILAKVAHDEHIEELVSERPDLEKFDLLKNMGYGTPKHIESLKKHGFTEFHRKTFIKKQVN